MSTEDKNRPKDKNHSLAMRPDDLLESQTPAIRGILDRICEIAAKISEPGQAHRSDAIANDDRPHYAFLIDGGRGSGKTFTLLTIWHVLRGLNGHPSARIDQTGESTFQDFLYGSKAEAAQADAKAEAKQKWKKLDHADALRSAVADRRASGLETIKIIFPGDMVGGDSVMESVFAEISERITSSLTTLDAQARSGGSKAITESMTKFKDLARRLREDVEQGWYFARRFGLEPLYRDSLDYEDLVQRWGDQVKRASFRIDNWRKFIRDFLDANEKSALVVMIDDSDVRPDLTEDVLHSIRMFLNHPRIIIVLAGNLKSMRDALVYQAMKRIGPSIDALNQDKHPSATEWRRRERQQIEEYLEKVLPPAQRYYISPLGHSAQGGAQLQEARTQQTLRRSHSARLRSMRIMRSPSCDCDFLTPNSGSLCTTNLLGRMPHSHATARRWRCFSAGGSSAMCTPTR